MIFVHFDRSEFECKCGCGQNLMADDFILKCDQLRQVLRFPLIVSSGYRCPTHNVAVSTTGIHGPHTTGRAVDFAIFGHKAHKLIQQASLGGWFTGIGLNQKGTHSKRFVHLDDLAGPDHPRPNVWTY